MAYTVIDKPTDYFNTVIWTADDSSPRTFTGFGHKPDFLWVKHRGSGSVTPTIIDSTRGGDQMLTTSSTANQDNASHGEITSFNADGFTFQNGSSGSFPRLYFNELDPFGAGGGEYVAWSWKANAGTTSTDTNGSLNSTVQASTTSGFSIVSYTSDGGAETVGHGLGSEPDFYIIKELSGDGDDWFCYHRSLGAGKKIRFNSTNAQESDTSIWQNTNPTSTVFSLQDDSGGVNQAAGRNYIGYFFRSIKGFQKVGKFIGNNSSDGAFVYLGFKPRFLLVKNATQSHANHSWIVFDSVREKNNEIDTFLRGNKGDAETTSGRNEVDFLSNGFKPRASYGDFNGGSDHEFIYLAVAEHPFVSSSGVPTTAR